jgi:hypothetical protein
VLAHLEKNKRYNCVSYFSWIVPDTKCNASKATDLLALFPKEQYIQGAQEAYHACNDEKDEFTHVFFW